MVNITYQTEKHELQETNEKDLGVLLTRNIHSNVKCSKAAAKQGQFYIWSRRISER